MSEQTRVTVSFGCDAARFVREMESVAEAADLAAFRSGIGGAPDDTPERRERIKRLLGGEPS